LRRPSHQSHAADTFPLWINIWEYWTCSYCFLEFWEGWIRWHWCVAEQARSLSVAGT